MSLFTVFGASGFVGRNLCKYLVSAGHEVVCPARADLDKPLQGLGHVIYAIGLTGDFRQRPLDTIDAHVNVLSKILLSGEFSSFLYLSSTRLYANVDNNILAREDVIIPVVPGADSLYDLSKLLGESLCLGQNNECVRIARLSNVYGRGQSRHTFLQMLIDEALSDGSINIRESRESQKDYVSVEDVVRGIENIALHGKWRSYNVASGECITHGELADSLAKLTGAKVTFTDDGPLRRFPNIAITRLHEEFGWSPRSLLNDIKHIV